MDEWTVIDKDTNENIIERPKLVIPVAIPIGKPVEKDQIINKKLNTRKKKVKDSIFFLNRCPMPIFEPIGQPVDTILNSKKVNNPTKTPYTSPNPTIFSPTLRRRHIYPKSKVIDRKSTITEQPKEIDKSSSYKLKIGKCRSCGQPFERGIRYTSSYWRCRKCRSFTFNDVCGLFLPF